MADELSGRGAGAVRPGPLEDTDPIHAVTGVSAEEILRRSGQMRRSGRAATRMTVVPHGVSPRPPASGGRRLLDFADLGDADFVHDAHRVLLGRRGSSADLERRLAELRAGRSRMEIVVRLALCPEGRRARRPPLSGIGLPALAATGAAIEALKANSMLRPAAVRSELTVRSALSRKHSRHSRRLFVAGAALAAAAAARRHRRRS